MSSRSQRHGSHIAPAQTAFQVCTKVASYLEQGQRLENLSWRLWHLQSLIVDTDNAKSKREFKKLSRNMGDKLDREKGRSIEELEAPDFKRNASTDLICQRAVERERSREASQNANLAPLNACSSPSLRGRQATRSSNHNSVAGDDSNNDQDSSPPTMASPHPQIPSLFSNDFDVTYSSSTSHHALSIFRPTIELPLDELLDSCNEETPSASSALDAITTANVMGDSDVVMQDLAGRLHTRHGPQLAPVATATGVSGAGRSASSLSSTGGGNVHGNGANGGANGPVKAECSNCGATHTPLWRRGLNDELNCNACGLYCKLHKRPRPKTMRSNHAERHSNTSTSHPPTQITTHTPTSSNAHGRHSTTNVRSGDVTGDGTHGTGYTNSHGGNNGGGRSNTSAGTNGSAQCYNCHTTATPLWRKDDEGKTVCNAYKLHGSARPISMKSDIIRKRSRHDASAAAAAAARRSLNGGPGLGALGGGAGDRSPTLAPDSTTQPAAYEFGEDGIVNVGIHDVHGVGGGGTTSGITLGGMNILGNGYAGMFGHHYPGPYHPDFLSSQFHSDTALPLAGVDGMDREESPGAAATDGGADGAGNREADADEHRISKRRRMSTDSASEPPSSAVSHSSYAESMTSSMDFPFFTPYGVFRGSVSNTFWHPPMVVAEPDRSPQPFIHPPMLLPDDWPTGGAAAAGAFLFSAGFHPPMLLPEEENLFATYFHPPMLLPSEEGDVQQEGGDTIATSAASQGENRQQRMDDGSR
ncbi:hypothetical protein EDD15DRAFT_2393244 [Pisolithus albus]|nr:hypothetical protein EDD15DRAFT_2393244 [Pisolithus albus]